MANQSRTQQRSTSSRFGRTSGKGTTTGRTASSRSASRSLRAGKGEAGAKGRFGLGSSLGPSGYGRSTSGGRSSSSGVSRRPKTKVTPQKSGMSRALSALGSKSGGKAATKASSRSAKPAGFALLAGAAGLALKNRDKLKGLGKRGDSSQSDAQGATYGDSPTPGLQAGPGLPTNAAAVTDGDVSGGDVNGVPSEQQRMSD